jgi:nickel/cobalt transporter (NicO) family protein
MRRDRAEIYRAEAKPMPDIAALLKANPWALLPVAVLLGALHALEPGHSKSMIAAFIVAIRGTMGQAVVLGLSAAIGHTIVVWVIALIGLRIGNDMIADHAEPYLLMLSGILIVAMAARMLWVLAGFGRRGQDHDHRHGHDHAHDHAHGHSHATPQEIAASYGGRTITTPMIAWFGFTGGLLPCPSAIAVLLISLQMKNAPLGMAMVLAFSLGLAMTMVSVGVLVAWGANKASKASSGRFDTWAAPLQKLSVCMVMAIGLFMTAKGWTGFR